MTRPRGLQGSRGLVMASVDERSDTSERLRVLHQVQAAVAEDVRREIAVMVAEDWPLDVAAEAVVRWWTGEVHHSAREGMKLAFADHRPDTRRS